MFFKCRHCGQIVKKDLRKVPEKTFMTKRGYRSYCWYYGKDTFLIPYPGCTQKKYEKQWR